MCCCRKQPSKQWAHKETKQKGSRILSRKLLLVIHFYSDAIVPMGTNISR